jgi:hypothetical protein
VVRASPCSLDACAQRWIELFSLCARVGAQPQTVVVGTGRRSTDIPCFAWINILLGNLKTALSDTYHAFNHKKYAHRYLAEYPYRFNRHYDLKAILPRL